MCLLQLFYIYAVCRLVHAVMILTVHVHSESKKLCHYTFIHNFDKCWLFFKLFSLLYSLRNLQQNRATFSTKPCVAALSCKIYKNKIGKIMLHLTQ